MCVTAKIHSDAHTPVRNFSAKGCRREPLEHAGRQVPRTPLPAFSFFRRPPLLFLTIPALPPLTLLIFGRGVARQSPRQYYTPKVAIRKRDVLNASPSCTPRAQHEDGRQRH